MKKEYIEGTVEKAKNAADFIAIISTAKEDRHGEVVTVEGWDIKEFKKNPVLLWAHDHYQPAIGHATKIWIEGTGKRAKLMIEGIINDATELSRSVKQLVQSGVIRTMSVGFRALEMDDNKFVKQELLETSFVNVPANSDALITAYKQLTDNGFSDEIMNQLGVQTEFVREIINMRSELKDLKNKTLAKEAQTSASFGRSVAETRQRTLKAIARASDQLIVGKTLPADKRDKTTKFIKKATEQLIKRNKEILDGTTKRTPR